jgi:SAM-dependent methyltransferase
VRERLTGIQPEQGFAYIASTSHPELSSHKRPSPARVLENGMPLSGPANSLHEDIRKTGRGRYSFWHQYIYFSTSDNSDPLNNGRIYEIVYPADINSIMSIGRRIFSGSVTDDSTGFEIQYLETGEVNINRTKSTAQVGKAESTSFHYGWLINILQRLGAPLSVNSTLLDFGCGAGECIDQLRKEGYNALGCDIIFPDKPDFRLNKYLDEGIIRCINKHPYKIPFENATFDIIFSAQVFEHVMDYDVVLAEIKRVLKPDGISVHIFPGRWKIRESHVYVPFSSVLKSYWWLYIWALTGIRNEYQAGFSAKQTALSNQIYLNNETNYLSRRQIGKYARRYFTDCRFCEEAYYFSRHNNLFIRYPLLLTLYRSWFSDFDMRVLVLGNKK